MPGEGHASPYLAEFTPHERQGRVEPELGPSTAPGTAYATVTSDSPSAAGLWGVVPEIDTEPRLFGSVHREAPLTWAASRDAPAERPHVGSVSYLLLFALIATAHFLWRRLCPAHTAQGPYRCRCRTVKPKSRRASKPATGGERARRSRKSPG